MSTPTPSIKDLLDAAKKASKAATDVISVGTNGDLDAVHVNRNSITGHVTTGAPISTSTTDTLMGQIKSVETTLADYRKNADPAFKDLITATEAQLKTAKEAAQAHMRELAPAVLHGKTLHTEAVAAVDKLHAATKAKELKDFQDAITKAGHKPGDAAYITAKAAHDTTMAGHDVTFEALRKPHKDALKGIQSVEENLAKNHSIRLSDHISGKDAAKLGGTGSGVMSYVKNVPGAIKDNAINNGKMGKAKVAVGAIGLVDGVRRVWNGVTADEEKGESRWGNITVGTIEAGVALAIGAHGGKSSAHAFGMGA